MLWLKRNLFMAVGGFIALCLLAFGLYYFWTNRQNNKKIETALEENKQTFGGLINKDPYPSPTNIARAKEEVQRTREAITNARAYFQPVPFEPVTDQAFKAVLDNSIFDLHKKAEQTSVILPSKTYAFTFEHQKRQLQFPPEAFPGLPQQLAEIKLICELLFDAKINKLITFRRARLYTEEPLSQVDHHEIKPEVDEQMGMAGNPYEVVFHAFSTDLAAALQSFYKSTNGLLVKAIAVEVAAAEAPQPNVNQPLPRAVVPTAPVPAPTVRQPPQRPAGAPAPAAKPEGLKTVLNEKLLKITLVLEVLRTLPATNPAQKTGYALTQTTR
jgi:hypothetical protein